jgi:hypothetical protein
VNTNLSFWGLLRRYLAGGHRHLFTVSEAVICCLIAGLVTLPGAFFVTGDYPDLARQMSATLFASAAGLLGVVLAGFAISAAMTDAGFSSFLYKNQKLLELLSPFWFSAAFWGLALGTSGVVYSLSYVPFLSRPLPYFVFFSTLTFAFALSFTLSLVGNTLKNGFYRAMYEATKDTDDIRGGEK